MAHVIVYPRGELSATDRNRLERAGIIVVEADNPSQVVQAIPMAGIVTGDAMVLSALEALSSCVYDSASKHFVKQLTLRAQAAEAGQP